MWEYAILCGKFTESSLEEIKETTSQSIWGEILGALKSMRVLPLTSLGPEFPHPPPLKSSDKWQNQSGDSLYKGTNAMAEIGVTHGVYRMPWMRTEFKHVT